MRGIIVDPSGAPVPFVPVWARLIGPKVEEGARGTSDSTGRFRLSIDLDASTIWYDSLAVGLGMTLCERWYSVVAGRPVDGSDDRQEIADTLDLVASPRPPGRLEAGRQSCSEVRRWVGDRLENSPFTFALIFDTVGDSVFGRFAINYLTASRSDTGPFRGAVTEGRLLLELLEDGTGGCRGPIPLSIMVGPGNTLTRGYIGPPLNRCTLGTDSVWMVTEPVDFFPYE